MIALALFLTCCVTAQPKEVMPDGEMPSLQTDSRRVRPVSPEAHAAQGAAHPINAGIQPIHDLRVRLAEPPPRPAYHSLSWTNPTRNGHLRGCSETPDSLVDLASARLMFWPRYGAAPVVLRVKSEAGRAGLRDSLAIPDTPYGTAWLELVDERGNAGPALLGGACGRRWIGVGEP